MHILRFQDLKETPWKNGGGITREIAQASKHNQMAWRLSCADISQDGAFSDFAGLVRILTVVSDSGMILRHSDGVLDVEPWVPIRFNGELKLHSQLKGKPLTGLNLMYNPVLCRGDVLTCRAPYNEVIMQPQVGTVVLHVLAGTPTINNELVSPGDTVFNTAPNSALKLVENEAVLEIRLEYLDPSNAIELFIADR